MVLFRVNLLDNLALPPKPKLCFLRLFPGMNPLSLKYVYVPLILISREGEPEIFIDEVFTQPVLKKSFTLSGWASNGIFKPCRSGKEL